jgi:hypothetical protein
MSLSPNDLAALAKQIDEALECFHILLMDATASPNLKDSQGTRARLAFKTLMGEWPGKRDNLVGTNYDERTAILAALK